MNTPFVSVIVLNYFGEKMIRSVVETLEKSNYPRNKFEILIVDNASKDASIQILKELENQYNNIELILLEKNLGFSKGNNIGIKHSKGEYVVLLNNDCFVDPNWLKELVKTAQNNPKVFAVNSKILLYPKYINLEYEVDPDLITQYSWLVKSNLYVFNKKRIYLNISKNRTGLESEVPFDPNFDAEIEIMLIFNCGNTMRSKKLKNLIKFNTEGAEVIECNASKNEVSYKIKIDLKNKSLNKKTFSKIQNAGIMPFQDGYARDIGSIVRANAHYYEHDKGQYNKRVEVYAACGAAMLMSKKVLEKIGSLDESFFMYYEDVEISERARIRGYKIYYSPKAVVRHLHALSSIVASEFFIFNVEKGRLLHVLYNFPLKVYLYEYSKITLLVISGFLKTILRLRHIQAFSKNTHKEDLGYRYKIQKVYVLLYMMLRFPVFLYLRYKKNLSLDRGAISKNYDEVLSGRWYLD